MSSYCLSRRVFLHTFALSLGGLRLSRAARQEVPSVDAYIRELAQHAPLRLLFKGTSALECGEWQQEFEKILLTLLGEHRPPAQWKTIRERRVELVDHYRDELILKADSYPSLPIYFLQPKDRAAPLPGIVALHGHGPYGYDPVAGNDRAPAVSNSISESNYDYGRQLVRRGFAVAVPCFTPFGRRADAVEAYEGNDICAVTYLRLQMLGKLLIAENLRDALWTFEFLARQETVDPGRIGCVGLSYGGRMAMLTSALEKRIRVAVISGALNVMQERLMLRYSCGAQIIPGLLEYGDVPEIASLIAPRPCLWEVGSRDGLIDPDWAESALGRMAVAYKALGASDQLQVDRFDGGHRWNGVLAYPLLESVLKRS